MAIDPIKKQPLAYRPPVAPEPKPTEVKPVDAKAPAAAPAHETKAEAKPALAPEALKDGFDAAPAAPAMNVARAVEAAGAPLEELTPTDLAPNAMATATPSAGKQPLAVGDVVSGLSAAASSVSQAVTETQGPPPERMSLTGEARAKKDVELETVAKSKTETEEAQKKLHAETTTQVNDIHDMADGKKELPPNTEVKRNSDAEAELTRKNDAGEVVERTVATRESNGNATLNAASYEGGVNKRDRIEAHGDGATRVRHAEWKGTSNETGALRDFDSDLDRVKDAGLTSTDNRVYNEDGRLKTESFTQAGGAVSTSRTSFYEQKGGKDIDDKLEKKDYFNFKEPVQRADTYSYSIPAPGADGTQPNPQYQRTQRFSQGDVQATSITDRELDGHVRYAGEGPHSREELGNVAREYQKGKGENYDANDAYDDGQMPKQWLMQVKKDENSLDTQTFLEGQPKVTTKTHTQVEGDTVTQTSTGQTLKPDSKDFAEVKGETKTKYGKDGSIENMDATYKEPDGTDVEEHYAARKEATDKGLKLDESMEVKRTKDGKTFGSKQEDSSLLSDQGVQLLGSKNTVTDPDGRVAVSEVGADGGKMSITGPGGADPREVMGPDDLEGNPEARDLLLNASASTYGTLQEFAKKGGVNALKAVQGLAQGADDLLPKNMSDALGLDNVRNTAQGFKGGVGALAGAAGVAGGVTHLIDGIREGNIGDIMKGAVDTALGGYDIYSGVDSMRKAFKGATDLVDIMGDDVAKAGGWLSKLPGASALAGSSAVSKISGALKGMGGVANVAGAILGTVTGAMDIADGVKGGHKGQIAQGALSIAGGIGGAVGGAIAAGAFGGPVGLAVGAVVGGFVALGQWIAGLIADDKHQIAKLDI